MSKPYELLFEEELAMLSDCEDEVEEDDYLNCSIALFKNEFKEIEKLYNNDDTNIDGWKDLLESSEQASVNFSSHIDSGDSVTHGVISAIPKTLSPNLEYIQNKEDSDVVPLRIEEIQVLLDQIIQSIEYTFSFNQQFELPTSDVSDATTTITTSIPLAQMLEFDESSIALVSINTDAANDAKDSSMYLTILSQENDCRDRLTVCNISVTDIILELKYIISV
jgi:hypothetical protein